jgi:hypothetical protein
MGAPSGGAPAAGEDLGESLANTMAPSTGGSGEPEPEQPPLGIGCAAGVDIAAATTVAAVPAHSQRRGRITRARAYFVERANAIIYLVCAFAFVPASLGFLPEFADYEHLAVWVFILGSLGFLWVAVCDARETWKHHQRHGGELAQFLNCCGYIFGSVLFEIGSFLFLPGSSEAEKTYGTVMFIVGSVAFTLAAFLNVTEVRRNTEIDAEQVCE